MAAKAPFSEHLSTVIDMSKWRSRQKLCSSPTIAAVAPTPGATGCPYTSIWEAEQQRAAHSMLARTGVELAALALQVPVPGFLTDV